MAVRSLMPLSDHLCFVVNHLFLGCKSFQILDFIAVSSVAWCGRFTSTLQKK